MNEIEKFQLERSDRILSYDKDTDLRTASTRMMTETIRTKYSYNFTWLGRPIIQYPQDMIAMQEIIWKVRPNLIVETGVAHGGSLIFYASLLELLGSVGKVVGIDIEIRKHNREELEGHPLNKRIDLIEGSSVDHEVFLKVSRLAREINPVLVVLDSNHTHEHVAQELQLYSTLVSRGSYCVVFDTIVEHLPSELCFGRPWGKGNNPMTAVREFLSQHAEFVVDREIERKLLLTAAPEGYLKRR